MNAIYHKAIEVFGQQSRMAKAQEEVAELNLALVHFQQGKLTLDQLCEEIEGVRMTLDMLELAADWRVEIEKARGVQLTKLHNAIKEARQ